MNEINRNQTGITLKDISEKLNVSMTSVHRAIYGKEGVSDKLRQRILEAANEMGYETNYAASSMKRKAVRIAVVLPSSEGWGSLYYAYFWKGYRVALKEYRALNVETVEYEVESEEGQIECLKRIADGDAGEFNAVMTFSYTNCVEVLLLYQRLAAQKITIMVLDDKVEGISGLYCIPSNDIKIGEMCAEAFMLMLPSRGRILVSSGRKGSHVHVNTIRGMKDYLAEHGSELHVEVLEYSEDFYQMFYNGLRKYEDAVGIFSLIARETGAMVQALEDTGTRRKMKVIGADLNAKSAQWLREDKVDLLIYKNAYGKGLTGFRTLIDCVIKHIEPPKNIQCEIGMIYKTSLDFYEEVIGL